jgi:hypothetical protein
MKHIDGAIIGWFAVEESGGAQGGKRGFQGVRAAGIRI